MTLLITDLPVLHCGLKEPYKKYIKGKKVLIPN